MLMSAGATIRLVVPILVRTRAGDEFIVRDLSFPRDTGKALSAATAQRHTIRRSLDLKQSVSCMPLLGCVLPDQCKCQARHSSERGRSTPSATSRANGCSSPGASRIVGRVAAFSSCKEPGKPRVLG